MAPKVYVRISRREKVIYQEKLAIQREMLVAIPRNDSARLSSKRRNHPVSVEQV